MADNVKASDVQGTSGPVFRSEDDGVGHWLFTKIAWGLSGVRNLVGSGSDALPIQDGGNSITVDATSLPLPTGASTGSKQDTGNTSLSSIDTKTATLVSGRVPVDPSGVTSPVSVASLPLPTNAATDTLQTTGNTSLSSIDGKLPSTLVSDRLKVDGSGVTQPISATTLPLPTGASVASQQGADVYNDVTAQSIYALGGLAKQLTQTIDGRLRVEMSSSDTGIDRRLQEAKILEMVEQSYRNLYANERSSPNYGYEVR